MKQLFLILILALVCSTFAAADLLEGLVLYMPLDEGNGKKTEDFSENGFEGELTGGAKWVDGKFGKALRFGGEGSDVFVTVESTAALNVNQCTFMAWINADHWNGVRQIVGKSVHGGCGGRTQYGLFSESGVFKLRVETENGRADISTDLPPTGEWVHVAFTNDGAMAKIYINGSSVVEGAVPGPLKKNDDPWRIGQDCERLNYVFAGAIDEVRLWNRALTTADIGELMPSAVAVDARGKLATTWSSIKTAH